MATLNHKTVSPMGDQLDKFEFDWLSYDGDEWVQRQDVEAMDGGTIVTTRMEAICDYDVLSATYRTYIHHCTPVDLQGRVSDGSAWWDDTPTFYVTPSGVACDSAIVDRELHTTGVWFGDVY